jgi:hypothetical protein
VVLILVGGLLYSSKTSKTSDNAELENAEQQVLESTLAISKNYLTLHLLTEEALTKHDRYNDYEDWKEDISEIIIAWGAINEQATYLEGLAKDFAKKEARSQSLSRLTERLITPARAMTSAEITDIYDKAPYGKKIQTLAQFLGTDAKRAQLILNSAQDDIQRSVWGEEGDAYQKMENTAIVVKDGCKVAGFVGGVVLSGGAAGFAASGVVAKTAVIVGGVDLVLEVGEDGANIALGDNNKVAQVIGEVRSVTEPVAGMLTIVNIPGNLSTAADKLGAITFGAEQIVSLAQDGKVIGINLVEAAENVAGTVKLPNQAVSVGGEIVSGSKEEVTNWAKSVKVVPSTASVSSVLGLDNMDLEKVTSQIIGWLADQKRKEKSAQEEQIKKEEKQKEENKQVKNKKEGSSKSKRVAMPYSEYKELEEEDLLKNIANVTKYLGEPDVKTTENGRLVYVYYDLVKYESGNFGSLRLSFYSEEDYRRFIENIGADWETNKEDNWDVSGGGITATTNFRSGDEYRKIYGE